MVCAARIASVILFCGMWVAVVQAVCHEAESPEATEIIVVVAPDELPMARTSDERPADIATTAGRRRILTRPEYACRWTTVTPFRSDPSRARRLTLTSSR